MGVDVPSDLSISLGVDVGGAPNAGEEQDGVLGLAVGERIDRLEIRIGGITTKFSKVNMERNLHSDYVSQKQTIKK